MKQFFALELLVVCCAQGIFANGFSDSVAAFTGTRTILLWGQDTWCNADYTPKSTCSGGNDLMMLDTKEGEPRMLVKSGGFGYIRIARSGKWATYNSGSKTMIVDLTTPGATPKVLLDKTNCTYWCARAMYVDQTTGTEYVFCLDNYDGALYSGSGIYKVPFSTSTGEADLSKATKVKCNSTERVDDAIAVSGDGKKLGGAFPWPATKILDTETGALADRHNGMFGCQANLAPDNSYRFHHCQDDHLGVIMFGPALAANNWFVNMAVNLVGLPSNSYTMDFAAPRWSNHVQFLMTSGPLCDNAACYEGSVECSFSATQVKSIKKYQISQEYLCKWSADFTKLEKSMYLTPDPRVKSFTGDAWLASGVVYPPISTEIGKKQSAPIPSPDPRIEPASGLMTVNSRLPVQVSLLNAQGRIVRHGSGAGALVLSLRNIAPGAYRLTATSAEGSTSRLVMIPSGQ